MSNNNKKANTNQVTSQAERQDPTGFLVLWLGTLAVFIIGYAIFFHKLQ
ncbi:MAG: hypothetical protein H6727_03995 [Myxococcales bacterium]|nr:hypothetical protein [Myxococcales bacterium]